MRPRSDDIWQLGPRFDEFAFTHLVRPCAQAGFIAVNPAVAYSGLTKATNKRGGDDPWHFRWGYEQRIAFAYLFYPAAGMIAHMQVLVSINRVKEYRQVRDQAVAEGYLMRLALHELPRFITNTEDVITRSMIFMRAIQS